MALLILMSTGSCAVLSGETLPANYNPTQMPKCSVGAGQAADIGLAVVYGVVALVGVVAQETGPALIGGLGGALHVGSAGVGSSRSERCRRARKAYATHLRKQQEQLRLTERGWEEQAQPNADSPLGAMGEIAPATSPDREPDREPDTQATSDDAKPLDAFWTETSP